MAQLALCVAVLALALLGLRPLLRGLDWWWCAVAVVMVAFGCATLVRLLLRHRAQPALAALPPLAALLGGGFVLHLLTASDGLLFGVLPGPALLGVDADLFNEAAQSIRAQHVPAIATPGILFLLCAVELVFAVLLEFVVVESELPLLAAPPVLLLLGAPLLFAENAADWWLWPAVLIGLIALLVEPGRLRWPALAAAVVVAACSLLLPSVLPRVGPASSPLLGSNGGVSANPVVDLGAQLRSGSTATVLRYTLLGTETPSYLRIATVSDFRGAIWQPDALSDTTEISDGQALPQPVGQSPSPDAGLVQERVRVVAVGGHRLPLPLAPIAVEGLDGVWRFDQAESTATADTALVDGQDYTVYSADLTPSAAQLAASDGGVPPGSGTRYLALPSMSATIAGTARQVIELAGATNRAAKAQALQDWFRSEFSYSLDAPVADGFDGDGAAAVAAFLKVRSGYCVHFASAMALMARTLGIPSRVVVGYLPGAVQHLTDGITGTVSAQELHAWPELWFDGVGWVRYEPTPEVAAAPSWAQSTDAAPSATPSPSTTAAASASPSASTRPSASASSSLSPSAPASALPAGSAASAAGTGWLLLGGVLLALLAAPRLAREVIRRGRLRRVRGGGTDAVAAAAAELRASAIDLGLPSDPAETLAASAERLGGAELAGFARLAERLVYARPGHGEAAALASALEAAVRSLRSVPGVSRMRRLRAAILPRSLWAGRMVAWTPRATGS